MSHFSIKENGQRVIDEVHSPIKLQTQTQDDFFGWMYLLVPISLGTYFLVSFFNDTTTYYNFETNKNTYYFYILFGYSLIFILEFLNRYFKNRFRMDQINKITHSFIKTINHFINKILFLKFSTFRNYPKWDVIFFRMSFPIFLHGFIFLTLNYSSFLGHSSNLNFLEKKDALVVTNFIKDEGRLYASTDNKNLSYNVNSPSLEYQRANIILAIANTKKQRLLSFIAAIFGFISVATWQLYSRKSSQFKSCLDSYNKYMDDLAKNTLPNKDAYLLKSTAIALEILHDDLWAHKNFSEFFVNITLQAFKEINTKEHMGFLKNLKIVRNEILRDDVDFKSIERQFYMDLNDGKICISQIGAMFDYQNQIIYQKLNSKIAA
ncbi:hypothetical protein M899_1441 [Bacteriovorax sp. BSW11_IV]|uniref:hypothetical protein n=1 Tax=Bacteriovorax sp. BSW11_IV TaxID=1353529 RepID=UPI00038A2F05|nr:hypothetical protein [Bacteriovorax sp. BSW11_IV]EQC45883.1 hypothetical protein M899_1441 [Bacteriovorax sp. BSW11_IV]